MAENIISKNISIKEIRRYKHQLSLIETKETAEQYHHNSEAEHTLYDKNCSNNGFLFTNNDSKDYYHTPKLPQYKIAFLKKVQLSLKASLSRADSLIHEYEELIEKEMENNVGYDHEITEMLMRFRLGIHSMLDETIRLSSQLNKEESSLQ
jgi:hypothetical protein